MPRTTDAAVKAITGTTRNTMPFIMTASLLVQAYLGSAGYSEPLLSEIETWWAAHLLCCTETQWVEKELGDSRIQLQAPKLGMGLEATLYGQQVLTLDTQGCLRTETTSKRPTFYID